MNRFTKFFVGAVAAIALSFTAVTVSNAAYTHTGLLKQGMTSSQVMSLQKTLNDNGFLVSATGAGSPGMESAYFGTKTKAAVMAFQTAKGLSPVDGIVGNVTGTALAASTGGSVTFPAGCTSTSGFSTTTGQSCASTGNTSLPAGCTSNTGFSTTTGQSCSTTVTLPAGCTSTAGYSPTTGAKCDGGSSSSNGPLQGGAGVVTAVNTTADVKTNLYQGATKEKVVAARINAQGSDVSISNVQVEFKRASGTDASDRIDRYVGNVSVWLEGNQVGSANISQFYREGSPYTYSYSIPLSGAVVRQGQSANLYVAVDTNSVIAGSTSSGDLSADIAASITSLRYTDATGAILSYSPSSVTSTFGFTSGYGADVSLSAASNNPTSGTLEVKANDTSSSMLLLAARLKNDSSATSSVKVNRVTANIAVSAAGSTANIDNVVNAVTISVNGQSYSATRSSSTSGALTSGAGNANYVVELNNGLTLNAGQSADITVNATFRAQSNYSNSAKVIATISGSNIDAETSNADADVSGTVVGSQMTLNSGTVASKTGGVYLAPVRSADNSAVVSNGYIGVTFEAGKSINGVTFSAATSGSTCTGTPANCDGEILYTTSGVTTTSTVSVYRGESINSDQKLTTSDKFYEGTRYTLVVDISDIAGGQNVPTIEITSIDGKAVSNVKYNK